MIYIYIFLGVHIYDYLCIEKNVAEDFKTIFDQRKKMCI